MPGRAAQTAEPAGPLAGLRVVEIGSIGPGPFAAMVLADLGADVLRIDRHPAPPPGGPGSEHARELVHRGRRSVGVNLKAPQAAQLILDLAERADVLIEGFRPGVAERLGFGPGACSARNPGIIYGRMTGWGQDGPLAQAAGHDINYIATAGALGVIGRAGQPPTPPLNLVGDYGGGGMLLAVGILAALVERVSSGRGQVIDAAMIDGTALLTLPVFGWRQAGGWSAQRGTNLVDSGAPFYDVYATADDRWLAIGAVEPHFYRNLIVLLGLQDAGLERQDDPALWPYMRGRIAAAVRGKTRDEWCRLADGAQACVSAVLDLDEVADHPHVRHRRTMIDIDGMRQPAPAPRFSRTPGSVRRPPPRPGEHTESALLDWGIAPGRVAELRDAGVAGSS